MNNIIHYDVFKNHCGPARESGSVFRRVTGDNLHGNEGTLIESKHMRIALDWAYVRSPRISK